MTATRIEVGGEAPYEVVVGQDVLGEIPAMLGERVQRVALVHPAAVADIATRVREVLNGVDILDIEIPDGERAKDVAVLAEAWSRLAVAGFTRSDAVVGVGGGATTDAAGFLAASWLRGVRLVNVPTTLLGMVDAAVGGKTGINIAEGKNLVGAFHSPSGVVCELGALTTLPRADYVAGMAEVIKTGFIADPRILDLVEEDPVAASSPDGPHTRELIARSVSVKAAVVAADLRENSSSGIGREMLNYGHTLAHAIEQVEGFAWRHGDAVAVGMLFVAALARRVGMLDDATAMRHRAIVSAVGLPTGYRAEAWPALHDVMRVDKKTRGTTLRFVVLEGLARPRILSGPEPADLQAAYAEVSA